MRRRQRVSGRPHKPASKGLIVILLWTDLWILIIQSSVPEQRANKNHMAFDWATTKRNLSSALPSK